MDADLARHCGITDPQAWRRGWRERLDAARRPGAAGALPAEPIDQVLLWEFALPLLSRLQRLAGRGVRPALGLNAPVGAGKSTLCRLLAGLAPRLGLRLAVASIDDFYLPWAARRRALAGNPFAVTRVPPGSHDPQLLSGCLDHWRSGGRLCLPRFDKTLREGEGDRCGEQVLEADALLLEGWLIGCRPLGAALEAIDLDAVMAAAGPRALSPAERAWLSVWDRALDAYQPAWERLDGLWLLRPRSWSRVWRWRFQAEARQRRAGGAALAPSDLDRLVRASLCSLPPELYLDPLLDPSPSAVPLAAVGLLDGRRRLLSVAAGRRDHSSALSSSLSIG
jgi:D-glycerate 3-kinase